MITRKDLAPLNDSDFEFWETSLKHRQNKTLWALYGFCQDFFTWLCPRDYLGCTCDGCLNQEICIRYKLTMKAVKQELKLREWNK